MFIYFGTNDVLKACIHLPTDLAPFEGLRKWPPGKSPVAIFFELKTFLKFSGKNAACF
jgi:hypothetical protein